MDKNNNGQPPATDDQELAQVLAGMNQPSSDQPPAGSGLQFEETGSTSAPVDDTTTLTEEPAIEPDTEPESTPEIVIPSAPEVPTEPVIEPLSEPTPEITPPSPVSNTPHSTHPELESIKKDALEQLRPLVDKLELPAQEKFDTLLLIIRSTDDQSLLAAASEAAKSIENDTKRAEALLDVIKEIDFFSHPQS